MADTTLSNKGLAYALLAIVGTAVLYIFGFSKGLQSLRVSSQIRANNQATIEALQKKLADLRTLEEQFARAESQVAALSVVMPADKQVAEVIAMLETMAARAGLILENVQPSAPSADGLPVTITVRGDYGRTLKFVEIMEKNVRPIRLGPINIAAGDSDLLTTFEAVFLYQVPAEDLPQDAASAPTEGTGM